MFAISIFFLLYFYFIYFYFYLFFRFFFIFIFRFFLFIFIPSLAIANSIFKNFFLLFSILFLPFFPFFYLTLHFSFLSLTFHFFFFSSHQHTTLKYHGFPRIVHHYKIYISIWIYLLDSYTNDLCSGESSIQTVSRSPNQEAYTCNTLLHCPRLLLFPFTSCFKKS